MNRLKFYKMSKGVLLFSLTLNTFGTAIGVGKLFEAINDYEIVSEITKSDPINTIDDIKFDDTRFRSGKYSLDDLNHAREAKIKLFDDSDYSFLNDMPNLEKLTIMDYRTLPIDYIDGSIFNKNMEIKIISCSNVSVFTKEKYAFLKDIPCIDTLMLQNGMQYNTNKFGALNIESRFLESLSNVCNLKLYVNSELFYNYKDLTFLDSLSLEGKPYNVAMFFNKDDIDSLTKAGVEVTTPDMNTFIKANNEIDEIVKNLNILSTDSEKEKVNKILSYILENYSYDKTVSKYIKEDKRYLINHYKFYEKGMLQGSLDCDTQICGNYAAMFAALAHSLDLNVDYVYNDTHAWDLVRVGDSYYYIDPTILEHAEICYTNTEVITVVRKTDSNEQVSSNMIVSAHINSVSFEKALNDGTVGNYSSRGYMDDISNPKHPLPTVLPVDLYISNAISDVVTSPIEINQYIYDKSHDDIALKLYSQAVKDREMLLIPFGVNLILIIVTIKITSKNIKKLEKTL